MSESCATDNTLSVKLQTIDNKVMFDAEARENPAVVVNYFPPIGTGKGYTPLELLMISFGTCVSTTIITLLRYRMKKTVSGISAEVNGTVKEEHPKALSHILLRIKINAMDLTESEVQETLKIAEDTMCPVWAMIKGNVNIDVETEICT